MQITFSVKNLRKPRLHLLTLLIVGLLLIEWFLVGCNRRPATEENAIPPVPENPNHFPTVNQEHLPPVLQGLSFGISTEEDVLARLTGDNLSITHQISSHFGGEHDLVWRMRDPNQNFPYNMISVTRDVFDHEYVGELYSNLDLVVFRFARSEDGRGPVLVDIEIAQPTSAEPSICIPASVLADLPGAMDACANRFPYQPRISDNGFAVCAASPDGRHQLVVRCVEPSSGEGTRRVFYTQALPFKFRLEEE